jgi:aspartate carbamoyltransferase catalytic subunit
MYVMGFMSAYDQHAVLRHVLDDVYQCLTQARYKYSDILNTGSNMYSHPLHVIMS